MNSWSDFGLGLLGAAVATDAAASVAAGHEIRGTLTAGPTANVTTVGPGIEGKQEAVAAASCKQRAIVKGADLPDRAEESGTEAGRRGRAAEEPPGFASL